MGLHYVQVPEYLYQVTVYSIPWWECWTSQPDGEETPICTPREELSKKEGLQGAVLGLLSSREPGSSSTNKLRAVTDALCVFSVLAMLFDTLACVTTIYTSLKAIG